jgi:hypothetical protein
MADKTAIPGKGRDSAIMPSVTVQIPMPPGASAPARPSSAPAASSSPAAPSPDANRGA